MEKSGEIFEKKENQNYNMENNRLKKRIRTLENELKCLKENCHTKKITHKQNSENMASFQEPSTSSQILPFENQTAESCHRKNWQPTTAVSDNDTRAGNSVAEDENQLLITNMPTLLSAKDRVNIRKLLSEWVQKMDSVDLLDLVKGDYTFSNLLIIHEESSK